MERAYRVLHLIGLMPGDFLETTTNKQSKLAETFRALRHRNYQLFFSGQLISLIGTWMDQIAESWLVYRLTGSALLLGTVAFAAQIPVFLLAPIGGALADRYNRRKLLVGTQSSMMVLTFILAWLTLSHRVHIWHIITLAALTGVVNALDLPARQAFVVDMVAREDLVNAIALNSSMFNGARVVGPAAAGIVVAVIGEGWCFFANGLSFIAVIVGLLLMRIDRPRLAIEGSPLENIIEGFQFVSKSGPVRALMSLLGLVSFTAMPYAVLMPLFADQILHGGPKALGLLMGSSGVGALCGALTLATRKSVHGLGKWVAVSCAGFGIALLLFSFSRLLWLSALLLVPAGFAMMLQMSSSNTLIQSMVPDRLRGRVMSVYAMTFMGMAPLGALLAGSLAHKLGPTWTVAIGGGISVIGAIIFGLKLPSLRPAAREMIIAQQMAGGAPAQEMTGRVFAKTD
ncbi:MAG TPA: MFS transporter [Candidatus Angelobacter sp.]|nr:MFS transporter [Candidatus Angelobacter sp.]